jgi:sugar lactone lactonase YvrE
MRALGWRPRRGGQRNVRGAAPGAAIAATVNLIMGVTSLHGQAISDPAGAASNARQLAASAAAALRAGDTTRAHQALVHATRAWPTQSAYLWTRAQVAIAAHDTADAFEALDAFAALGMTRALTGDRFLNGIATHPRFTRVAAQLATNGTPVVRSTLRATLPDSTLWPEGVAWDARAKRFYVASIRHRTIYAHDATGTRALWSGARADIGAMLGVAVDPDGRHLWATTAGIPQMAGYAAADSSIAAVLKLRVSDGRVVARWDLPPSAIGHTLGDITVAPNGDVFASDSREPKLYRLRGGAGALEAFTSPLFRSLQGVAAHPDGRHVYVADYSHGILRVDLRTRAVIRLPDAPSSTSLGVDGLTWYRGALIAIQNGVAPARVMRFQLDPSGERIAAAEVLDRNRALADEPTIGTLVGDSFVYIANSQWDKHDDAGMRIPGTILSSPRLLSVPLTPKR